MSGGNPTLMRTRCPECGSVFRVTSEQLRRKAGKVRCGNCQAVFNAFDNWLAEAPEDVEAPATQPAVPETQPQPAVPVVSLAPVEPEIISESFDPAATIVVAHDWQPPVEAFEPAVSLEPVFPLEAEISSEQQEAPLEPQVEPRLPPREVAPRFDAAETLVASPADHVPLFTGEMPPLVAEVEPASETPEQTTQAAREAGLVAARELADSAAYNRWSAGTLASDGRGLFDAEESNSPRWPFVVVAILLGAALLAQFLFHFRTEIVQRLPSFAVAYEAVGVTVPLPRNPALVSIESSDLQSDNARGLFVLQATLKNRAAVPQAWPALELSLTDTNDAIVSRRVMYAADYLPSGTQTEAFPANGETAIRLWIEAKGLGASGYRLYIFYP